MLFAVLVMVSTALSVFSALALRTKVIKIGYLAVAATTLAVAWTSWVAADALIHSPSLASIPVYLLFGFVLPVFLVVIPVSVTPRFTDTDRVKLAMETASRAAALAEARPRSIGNRGFVDLDPDLLRIPTRG